MLIDKDKKQYVMITLEEYKNLLIAYSQYCLYIQMQQPSQAPKEKTKEKIGFK
jgi:hypothetical protein